MTAQKKGKIMYCMSEQITHTGLAGVIGSITTMTLYLLYHYRSRICVKCKQPFFIKDLHKGVMDYYCGSYSKPVHPFKFWAGFVIAVSLGFWLAINIGGIR